VSIIAFIFYMAHIKTCNVSVMQIFYKFFKSTGYILPSILGSFPSTSCLQGHDVGAFITYLHREPHVMFEHGGIVELLGEDTLYKDVSKAMRQLAG
jgi:hypothetical protein